ncbi:MAG TPA: sugar transferase [Dehalococcoidia bacterium]
MRETQRVEPERLSRPVVLQRPGTAAPGRAGSPPTSTAILAPPPHWGYSPLKRAVDVAGAAVLLAALSPLFLALAALICLDSRGPAIYRQQRAGYRGRPFRCYKFRTMRDGADSLLARDPGLRAEFAARWKLERDPRVTRVGRWLRRTSLDELPQLFNVLRGEMSLVGPRPVQPDELRRQFGPYAAAVTSVKPGLTGLWQVSGRSALPYRERVRLELEYVRRRSLPYDVAILLRTVPAVLSGRGAA